jgi:xanthine dehydrogenase YagR molybdenum-binding subunit
MSPLDMPTKHGDSGDGVGARLARLDGALKVTGATRYALDQPVAGVAHAVLVTAGIAAGRIRRIDTAAAKAAPGVLLVLTPERAGTLTAAADWLGQKPAQPDYRPLDSHIRHDGQPIAAVVAETLEQAREAASLLAIDYEAAPAITGLDDPAAGTGFAIDPLTAEWGDADAALAAAPVRIEAEYRTPREYQMAIEPHGLIAEWGRDAGGETLTLHEPSQWIDGMARSYAEWFGLGFDRVRIVSPYVGGGFGSKAFVLAHGAVAAIAARRLGRPVKLVVTRSQIFTLLGGRAATRQTLALGATAEGKLLAIRQRGANETSLDGVWPEPLGSVTAIMYAVPHLSSRQSVVPVNTVLPGAKRAPGENPSAFGLECAMDELAYAVGADPLAIRLLNYAETDPHSGKPWSTRQLREAFAAGAETFGWQRRIQAPRSMRDGRLLIGWGLAAGTYPVRRTAGEALVRILADGSVEVATSASDMGTGAYTILAQAAAAAIGVPAASVRISMGDSRLPRAPVSGGSQMAGLMMGAVDKAARAARDELIGLALSHPASPLAGIANALIVADGRLAPPRGDTAPVAIADLLAATGRAEVSALRDTLAENGLAPEDRQRNFTTVATMRPPTDGAHSMHSWAAHFIEVAVDEDFGTVRVRRVVSALDSGLLYNPKLAESQWKGGIIMGIGQALLEEGVVDPRHARVVNDNLGDYLLPTNADIPDIQVISVGVPDPHASALGGKGVGELGIVGVAPAIANAVFHATGKRIRELPITLDRLL